MLIGKRAHRCDEIFSQRRRERIDRDPAKLFGKAFDCQFVRDEQEIGNRGSRPDNALEGFAGLRPRSRESLELAEKSGG